MTTARSALVAQWVGVLLLCLVSALASHTLIGGMPMPLIHADEGSYLLNAIALAGRMDVSLSGDYYSGYSLLLVPFAHGDVLTLHRAALILNVLLVACLPIAYYWTVRLVFPSISTINALAAAGFGAFLPSHLYYTQLAFSDNLLVFAYGFSLLSLALALRGRRGAIVLAAASGLLLAWCYLGNPRGLVTGAAVTGTAALLSIRHRSLRPVALVLLLSWIGGSMLHGPLESMALRGGPQSAYSTGSIVGRLFEPGAWFDLLRNVGGVFAHTMLASVGMLAVVCAAAFVRVRHAAASIAPDDRPGYVLPAVVAMAVLAAVGVTALFFLQAERADQLIYGRYVAGVLGPALSLGFAELVMQRQRWAALAVGSGATLVVLALLWWSYATVPPPEFLAPVNVVEGYPFLRGVAGVDWKGLGFGLALLATVLYATSRIAPVLAGTIGVAYFIALASWVSTATVHKEIPRQLPQLAFFERIEAVAALSSQRLCIDMEPHVEPWHRVSYWLYLWPHFDDPASRDPVCERAVLASAHDSAALFEQGYIAVALDVRQPYALLLPPGARQDAAAASGGSLGGADMALPLPPDAQRADVRVQTLMPDSIAAGTPFDVLVHVRNTSSTAWLHRTRDNALVASVRLGAQLVPSDGGRTIELRADISQPIAAGAEQDIVLRLPAALPAGNYSVRVAMLNEGHAWFGCGEGDAACRFPLQVR